MNNTSWVLLIVGGLAAGFWKRVKGLLRRAMSLFVHSVQVRGNLKDYFYLYCEEQLQPSRFHTASYWALPRYVKPIGDRRDIVFRQVPEKISITYWKGWIPLWVSQEILYEWHGGAAITVTTLRGLIDFDQLMHDALEFCRNNASEDGREVQRFEINMVTGRPSHLVLDRSGDNHHEESFPASLLSEMAYGCPVGWSLDDLKLPSGGRELEELALPPGGCEILKDIDILLMHRDWYRERGLPWKRGYLLYGPPGNGKTKMVRALAKHHDLPVFLFDLPTLSNAEFRKGWERAQTNTPALVVIEDFDAVFDGRKNQIPDSKLTFDCILNTIDGVGESDGIILFITTNQIEKLDPALGGGDIEGTEASSRPGRIDRVLHMGPPNDGGRRKILSRILDDDWDIESEVVRTEGMTGAQIQEHAMQLALKSLLDSSKTEHEALTTHGAPK